MTGNSRVQTALFAANGNHALMESNERVSRKLCVLVSASRRARWVRLDWFGFGNRGGGRGRGHNRQARKSLCDCP